MRNYAALTKIHRELYRLRHADAILSWDDATMMPASAGRARAEALSTLRGLIHQQATQPHMADLFAGAADESGQLQPWDQANLREMRREWLRATALPQSLVEAASRAESHSEQAWRRLRATNDFAGFLPFFRDVVRLKQEAARALSEKLGLSPYDALLDAFEPGMKVAQITPLFARLRAFLPTAIGKTMARQRTEAVATCAGPYPVDRQRELGIEMMRRLGFDFRRGRLDTSHHPFCGGVPEDVRIATRYRADDFLTALYGVVHECGHAKYQQHLPQDWLGLPVAEPRGSCVHESQSLLLEMHVGRSRAFAEFAAPMIAAAFPDLAATEPDAFDPTHLLRQLSRVRPTLIRVDADELTYPCHIILRFELEKQLLDGSLQPEDVPDAWDAGMREMLGLSTRGNDRDGCMQDVHWPAGMFGYFPSYALGALAAAQFFRAAKRTCADLMVQIGNGDFARLDDWLDRHIWSQGSFRSTSELIEGATGAPLSTEAFEEHVERRYVQGEG
jgi:carboxypeptidase Taq